MKDYCIKQHDITDCGAACLATICRQNGYKIGISKSIKSRLKQIKISADCKYETKLIHKVYNTDASIIYDFEIFMHDKYHYLRYKPKVSFHGMSECFKGLDIKQVITDMNEIDEGVDW